MKLICETCMNHTFAQCADNPCGILLSKPRLLDTPIQRPAGGPLKIEEKLVQELLKPGGAELLAEYLGGDRHVNQLRFEDEPLLIWACRYAQQKLVELLLSYGAEPRSRCSRGLTALYYAVRSGCLHVVESLLEAGCNVNGLVKGHSYLFFAIEANHPQMVQLLLHSEADANLRYFNGNTALQDACRLGRLEMVKLLLGHGARLECKTKRSLSPLAYAVISRKLDVVRALDQHGANLYEEVSARCLLLHIAASTGSSEALCYLIDRGHDVDSRTVLEETPLHLAVEGKSEDVLGLLLNYNSDVNARNLRWQTPLHFAVEFNWPGAMYELLARGAEPEPRDRLGLTPLALAASLGRPECLEPLLIYGADPRQLRLQPDSSCPYLLAGLRNELNHYAIKRRVAQLAPSPGLEVISSPDEAKDLQEFEAQCLAEVEKMRTSRFHGDLTYLGFLHCERRRLVALVSLPEIYPKFLYIMARKLLHYEFPLYASMIEHNFFLGLRYVPVYEKAVDSLGAIVCFALPLLPLEKILSYLNVKDMDNIIKAHRDSV